VKNCGKKEETGDVSSNCSCKTRTQYEEGSICSTTATGLKPFAVIMIIIVLTEWRKLHYEELRDLYFSPNIIRMIKSRRMRWAGHVARMGEKRNAYRLLLGKPRDH
jgi:hypothetical protein